MSEFNPQDPAGVFEDTPEETTSKVVRGRPVGSRNKLVRDALANLEASGKQTPLEYLLEVMHDDEENRFVRMDAAKAAAPYVHPKLATVTTKTPNDELHAKIQALYLEKLATMRDDGPPPPVNGDSK